MHKLAARPRHNLPRGETMCRTNGSNDGMPQVASARAWREAPASLVGGRLPQHVHLVVQSDDPHAILHRLVASSDLAVQARDVALVLCDIRWAACAVDALASSANASFAIELQPRAELLMRSLEDGLLVVDHFRVVVDLYLHHLPRDVF